MRATTTGDVQELLRLLAEDVVSIGDGGGKAPALAHTFGALSCRVRVVKPRRIALEFMHGDPLTATSISSWNSFLAARSLS